MIKFVDITKVFQSDLLSQSFCALKNLSFKVEKGHVVGFLGANGAGKTTSLKIAMDFIRPTEGKIIFDESLGKNKKEIFKNIGFLPERPYFYPHLTGYEFTMFMGKISGMNSQEIKTRIDILAPKFKIDFALNREIRNYSKGMLQRIGFLVTLLHDPKLIILDEPLSGLDPIGRKDLKDIILDLKKEGKTIFFSSHIISDVEEICDDVIFIKDGELMYQGKVDDLLDKSGASKSRIRYKDSQGIHLVDVNDKNKSEYIKKLVNDNKEILQISIFRPTLEEVIYNVK